MNKEISKILIAGTEYDIRDSRFKELTELEEQVSANEQARVAAETNRESAETDRANAEAARVEAEAARAEEFAGFTATLAAKEDVANKVTSINADADDVHYPTAKAVWSAIEDKFWYGIEKDTTVSTPTCTRIGNMEFHRTLPVHSLMRGCLLADDGTVNKYLDPDDWTNEVRDGSQGQVMVEIPRHYRKCETDGNIIRVKLSLLPLDGFLEVPKMYVSAYEAALERSTNKLCSVVNEGSGYRGGYGNMEWDGTYRSLLGKPVTNINRTNFRNYARNRNTATAEWNCYTYDVHVTLWWLFVTEYATLNSQADYNEELTAEGYHQGGLGPGLTNMEKWTEYNGYNPFAKCGYTDNAGNKTTQAILHIENDDASISLDMAIPRYRGVENPYGHLWKIVDGITVIISPTVDNGGDGTSKAYVASDPKLFNDTDVNGYRLACIEERNAGFVKTIQFGEFGDIVPTKIGASSSTYYCDWHYVNIFTAEAMRFYNFGGDASGGPVAGFIAMTNDRTPSHSLSNIGTRLCFIPKIN